VVGEVGLVGIYGVGGMTGANTVFIKYVGDVCFSFGWIWLWFWFLWFLGEVWMGLGEVVLLRIVCVVRIGLFL